MCIFYCFADFANLFDWFRKFFLNCRNQLFAGNVWKFDQFIIWKSRCSEEIYLYVSVSYICFADWWNQLFAGKVRTFQGFRYVLKGNIFVLILFVLPNCKQGKSLLTIKLINLTLRITVGICSIRIYNCAAEQV